MIACASADGVSGPKFIVPRQRRLTDRPERPRLTYSIRLAFHGGTAIHLAVRGHPLAGAAGGPFGRKIVRMGGCDAYRVPSGGRPVRTARLHPYLGPSGRTAF